MVSVSIYFAQCFAAVCIMMACHKGQICIGCWRGSVHHPLSVPWTYLSHSVKYCKRTPASSVIN